MEAELIEAGHTYDETTSRVGRVRDRHYASYESFRLYAMPRLGFEQLTAVLPSAPLAAMPEADEEERYAILEFTLSVFWTLKSLLGPLIESLIVLDRYFLLVEGLPERHVELFALFDQDVGSLRNLCMVVR